LQSNFFRFFSHFPSISAHCYAHRHKVRFCSRLPCAGYSALQTLSDREGAQHPSQESRSTLPLSAFQTSSYSYSSLALQSMRFFTYEKESYIVCPGWDWFAWSSLWSYSRLGHILQKSTFGKISVAQPTLSKHLRGTVVTSEATVVITPALYQPFSTLTFESWLLLRRLPPLVSKENL